MSKGAQFTNLEELENLARKKMTKQAFDYYRSGADSQASVGFNNSSFKNYRLLPRVLVNVSNVDTSVDFLGRKLAFPIMIAPMAMQRLAHEDGELAVARCSSAHQIPMVQSTMGTVPLAKVAKAGKEANSPLMLFQLYVIRDRSFTKKLIQDAEKAGYEGLVITVDAPQLGRREADERNSFKLPSNLRLENLEGLTKEAGQNEGQQNSAIAQVFASYVDPGLGWDFIAWVRTVTKLPLILKGILDPQDALKAVEAGVEAIIVSNHGGRQLDFAPSPLEVLPSIASAVNRRIPIWIDGGVRRGTDIIKCLILGASGVLIGRPIVYGLALDGENGVDRVLKIIEREYKLDLQLMGCPSTRHLTSDRLIGPDFTFSRL